MPMPLCSWNRSRTACRFGSMWIWIPYWSPWGVKSACQGAGVSNTQSNSWTKTWQPPCKTNIVSTLTPIARHLPIDHNRESVKTLAGGPRRSAVSKAVSTNRHVRNIIQLAWRSAIDVGKQSEVEHARSRWDYNDVEQTVTWVSILICNDIPSPLVISIASHDICSSKAD